MEFGDAASAFAGLGGTGVAVRAGIHFMAQAHKERVAENNAKEKAKHDAEKGRINAARKAFEAIIPSTGAFVHRMFAICSFVILMAPIILPLFFDVTVHYYWPKNLDFIFFEIEKMKEITAGNGDRHIMILPVHITTSLNTLSFYLTGKALK